MNGPVVQSRVRWILTGLLCGIIGAGAAAAVPQILWSGQPQEVVQMWTNTTDQPHAGPTEARLWMGSGPVVAGGVRQTGPAFVIPPSSVVRSGITVSTPSFDRPTAAWLDWGGRKIPLQLVPTNLLASLPQPVAGMDSLPESVASALKAAGLRTVEPGERPALIFAGKAISPSSALGALRIRWSAELPVPVIDRRPGGAELCLPMSLADQLGHSASAHFTLWSVCQLALQPVDE